MASRTNFRSRKTPPRLQAVWFLLTSADCCNFLFSRISRPTTSITTCHHQRQGPNYKFSCGAAGGPAQDTWFVHNSDSPVPKFWKLEFSVNEHVVVPTSLQPPNIGLFPVRAGGQFVIAAVASDLIATWPHKQKSFRIDCGPTPSVAALTTAANSDSPLLTTRTPLVLDHAFTNWPLHIAAPPHWIFSWSGIQQHFASPTHLNIVVQLGPWISAGHSWVFECVPCNSLEGSEVLCTW